MRSFLFLLLLVIFPVQALLCQELPRNMTKVKVSPNLKEGFYLWKSEKKDVSPRAEIVKRLGEGIYIIHLSGTTKNALPEAASLYKVSTEWKLSPALLKSHLKAPALLSVKTIDPTRAVNSGDYKILQQHGDYLVLKADPAELQLLLQDENIIHISLYNQPQVESFVSYQDLSVNRINYLQHQNPDSRGENLRVSVKENLFEPEDLDLWNRSFPSNTEAERLDQHATIIATLIAGAGNSGSKGKGVAPGAEVGSSSFLNLFPDPNESFTDLGITVQNHSYGTSLEYEYGNEAAAYDASIAELPWLVHVFSSGNSGTETPATGSFEGIQGYANLTGNFKFAKNSITVGALDAKGQVPPQSSKGPTYDGRLKPELVAYAPAGTSDAAALVSGTVLLLQEEYLKQHQQLPTSALIKSALIAGAEDVGPENIDFSSGYGNLDANASMQVLHSGSYFQGEVSEAETVEYELVIPEGTRELKLALSWIDPAANPGDHIALVNDLDFVLISPEGTSWSPWILDPENIEGPAQRGKDTLNPVEFISLEEPAAGAYTVVVSAAELSEKQAFSIAYATEAENSFTWTYPTSSDPLYDDQENLLRWQNTFSAETAKLELKIGDSDWELLEQGLDLTKESYSLNLQKRSGIAQLRMTVSSREYVSDTFVIAPEILPEVAYNCEDEFLLTWNKIEGASAYQVRYLGELYMEPAMQVQDTTALIKKSEFNSRIWSVTPLFGDLSGHEGRAIDYSLQGVGCHYRNFFALLEPGPVVNTRLNLSSGLRIREVHLLRENPRGINVIGTFSAPFEQLLLEITDKAPEVGKNLYYALIILEDGQEIRTEGVELFVPGKNTLEVYPNPIKAGENLSVRSLGDQLEFEIFDSRGRKLSTDWLVRYNDHVEIKFFARGMYIIRALRGEEEVGIAKIIVY